jgi:hypothetical protein
LADRPAAICVTSFVCILACAVYLLVKETLRRQ